MHVHFKGLNLLVWKMWKIQPYSIAEHVCLDIFKHKKRVKKVYKDILNVKGMPLKVNLKFADDIFQFHCFLKKLNKVCL